MYLAAKHITRYMEISMYLAMKHMARYMEVYMYLAAKHIARYMEISLYLAMKHVARYMEVSMYFAAKHIARYMEISMYLATFMARYMEISMYFAAKHMARYMEISMCLAVVCEMSIVPCYDTQCTASSDALLKLIAFIFIKTNFHSKFNAGVMFSILVCLKRNECCSLVQDKSIISSTCRSVPNQVYMFVLKSFNTSKLAKLPHSSFEMCF